MYRNLPNYRALYAADDATASGGTLIGGANPEPVKEQEAPKSDADLMYDDPPEDGTKGEPEQKPDPNAALKTKEQVDAEAAAAKTAEDAAKAKTEADAKAAADKTAADAKAKTESEARQKAYADAKTPEEKKTAYDALDDEQKRLAYDAMSLEDRKALGVEAPVKTIEYKDPELPEGVTLDKETLGKAMGVLSGLKGPPTQGQLQELVNLYSQNAINFANKVAQGQYDKFIDTRKGWVDEIKADPAVGGKNLAQSNALVAIAKKSFVNEADMPKFLEALEITGAGDNPAFYRFMVAVGKAHKDDKLEIGDAHSGDEEQSAANILYDK